MILAIEFRDTRHAGWQRCRMNWTLADIAFLNKTVGYEKYRVVRVTA